MPSWVRSGYRWPMTISWRRLGRAPAAPAAGDSVAGGSGRAPHGDDGAREGGVPVAAAGVLRLRAALRSGGRAARPGASPAPHRALSELAASLAVDVAVKAPGPAGPRATPTRPATTWPRTPGPRRGVRGPSRRRPAAGRHRRGFHLLDPCRGTPPGASAYGSVASRIARPHAPADGRATRLLPCGEHLGGRSTSTRGAPRFLRRVG